MLNSGIGTTTLTQVGIIVRDIEQSIDHYCRVLALPRPTVIITDEYSQAQTLYRGQPTAARAKLAFFNLGQVSLELIEPIGEPSTWKEYLDAKGEGVHHLAFVIQGTDQVVQFLHQQGIAVVQQGYYTGGMYTYLSSEPQLGVALELLENFKR
jgi:methylmalonyl-CoA/ethylmalonyl-CoA epimerase